ncbi:hypothetical protein [Microtetraspora niveoalba]|uniref:hypothetical protein n=1 Tax=Microtetraspora niveoalba TaxID=46175 RepID=UPI00082E0D28|nr:hypothetical protein [Microtetraspora niveoalba]
MTTPEEQPETTPSPLEAMMIADDTAAAEADAARWRYGFYVVLTGLVVTLVGFSVAVVSTGQASTLFAGLAGVVGTLTGAYFGVQSGQSGKAKVEAELRRVNDRAMRMASYVGPQHIEEIMGRAPGGKAVTRWPRPPQTRS